MVRWRRLLLCDTSMVCCLGSQHETEGKDHRCLRSQSWCFVSLESNPRTRCHLSGIHQRRNMRHRPHCSLVRLERIRVHLYVPSYLHSRLVNLTPSSTDDTVPMLIWSATESCVTIMCSSIPVLRPLYVRVRYGKDGKSGSSGNTPYKLPLYGSGRKYGKLSISGPDNSTLNSDGSPYQKTVISYNTRNTSDETIMRSPGGIARTDEISVSYEQYGKQG